MCVCVYVCVHVAACVGRFRWDDRRETANMKFSQLLKRRPSLGDSSEDDVASDDHAKLGVVISRLPSWSRLWSFILWPAIVGVAQLVYVSFMLVSCGLIHYHEASVFVVLLVGILTHTSSPCLPCTPYSLVPFATFLQWSSGYHRLWWTSSLFVCSSSVARDVGVHFVWPLTCARTIVRCGILCGYLGGGLVDFAAVVSIHVSSSFMDIISKAETT